MLAGTGGCEDKEESDGDGPFHIDSQKPRIPMDESFLRRLSVGARRKTTGHRNEMSLIVRRQAH